MESSKISESSLLQSVRQLARLLTLSKETASAEVATKAGKTDVVLPLTPAVLETLEKSIKAEVLPIQLHAAVNEVSNEVVSQYLVGLVSSQLVAAPPKQRTDNGGGVEKVGSINLLHVNDFSPEEVVKEVEVFVSRKVRAIAGRNPYGALDPGLFSQCDLFGETLSHSIFYVDFSIIIFNLFVSYWLPNCQSFLSQTFSVLQSTHVFALFMGSDLIRVAREF